MTDKTIDGDLYGVERVLDEIATKHPIDRPLIPGIATVCAMT